jgi:bifunctional non-homologous end joining protein LigD
VLWPKAKFTKAEAIDYYARIAETMLPHLRGRPLTRVRFPDGVASQRFFEKRAPKHTPDWVKTAPIEMGTAGVLDFIVCDDRATLIWLAQLAALELHPSLALAKKPERPTVLAFDLDPGAPATAVECAQIALRVRELFAELGLECLAKHSGSKGIQVYVPLNVEGVDYDHGSKALSHALARHLEAEHPKLIVSQQKKELRKGKVLIDWSQNDENKTTVGVYSLRARERPTVSTPLAWEELEHPEALVFEAADVLERFEQQGDLFAPVVELQQELPEL